MSETPVLRFIELVHVSTVSQQNVLWMVTLTLHNDTSIAWTSYM